MHAMRNSTLGEGFFAHRCAEVSHSLAIATGRLLFNLGLRMPTKENGLAAPRARHEPPPGACATTTLFHGLPVATPPATVPRACAEGIKTRPTLLMASYPLSASMHFHTPNPYAPCP